MSDQIFNCIEFSDTDNSHDLLIHLWLCALTHQRAREIFQEEKMKLPDWKNSSYWKKDKAVRLGNIAVEAQNRAIREILELYRQNQLHTDMLKTCFNSSCTHFIKPPLHVPFSRLLEVENFLFELRNFWHPQSSKIPFVFKREARDIFEVPEEVFNLANKYGFDSREYDEFIMSSYNMCVDRFLNGPYKLYIERVAETSFIEYEKQKSVLSEVPEFPQNSFDVPPLFKEIACATLGPPIDLMDLRLVYQNFYEKVATRKAEFEAFLAQEREQFELGGGAFCQLHFKRHKHQNGLLGK